MEVTILATPLTIFFFLFRQATVLVFIYLFIFSLLHFQHLNFHNSPSQKRKKKIATIPFSFSPALASHNSFLLFFPPQHFGQLNCHNSFFFPSPPQFWQLHCLTFFFSSPLQFQQLHCHTQFLFFSLLFGHSSWVGCILGRNFGNYITKIQLSLSPSITSFLSHFSYFFLEFWQHNCRNLLLSLFSQISLNSAHITNKLHFL